MEESQPQDSDNYNLIESFSNAFSGLGAALKSEPTFRIQLVIAIAVVVLGFVFDVSLIEWVALALTIGWVLSLELINTQIEKLIDFFHPEHHKEIRRIKNITAAAVLLSTMIATVVAILIFLPKFS